MARAGGSGGYAYVVLRPSTVFQMFQEKPDGFGGARCGMHGVWRASRSSCLTRCTKEVVAAHFKQFEICGAPMSPPVQPLMSSTLSSTTDGGSS